MLTDEVIRLELIKIFGLKGFAHRVELWDLKNLKISHTCFLGNEIFLELSLLAGLSEIVNKEDIERFACSVIERMNDKIKELNEALPELEAGWGQKVDYTRDGRFYGRVENREEW